MKNKYFNYAVQTTVTITKHWATIARSEEEAFEKLEKIIMEEVGDQEEIEIDFVTTDVEENPYMPNQELADEEIRKGL